MTGIPAMVNLTTAQQMAVMVLQGDNDSARVLADYLMEHYANGDAQILPTRRIVDFDKVRIIVYPKGNAFVSPDEQQAIARIVKEWLANGKNNNVLIAGHVDRIEVFEVP